MWEPLFSALEMFFSMSWLFAPIHALLFLLLPLSFLYLPFPLSSSTTGESIVEQADMCGSHGLCCLKCHPPFISPSQTFRL